MSRALPAAVALVLTSCSLPGAGSSTRTPPHSAHTARVSARPTPSLTGTTRTVLTQLGLNIHASPSTGAPVVGTASEGTQLTVIAYQAAGGGWFKVQGQTVTGWIVADPSLTAAGAFTLYQDASFSALYPQTWTFAVEPAGVLFRPQHQGAQSMVVRLAANPAAFGQPAQSGYGATFSQQQVVCGYTGELVEYTRQPGAALTTPSGSTATPLQNVAEIRLKLDAAHAMDIVFNYSDASQLDVYRDFYASISFPYPLCQAPAPGPT